MSSLRHGASLRPDGSWVFDLWAPHRREAVLRVADRQVPMARGPDATFSARVEDLALDARYSFLLDDEIERPDPASRYQPDGVHASSQVVDHRFDWQSSPPPRPLEEYVIYELHVGTFTKTGTFDAAIERLDDLAELGVTAVELMPVAAFPGERNWGYDGVFPFAVEATYGGPQAMKRFVDACHLRGLSVILDVVYNHLGPEGNYLRDFGPYFTDDYHTPWGEALNFDGAGSDYVREFFVQNALQWVDEFRIDGLRLDAVHAIFDRTARPFLEVLTTAVHELARERDRDIWLFAETNQNDPRVVVPVAEGGLGHDSMWVEDLHHAIHARLTGEQAGYYVDYGDTEGIARALDRGFVLRGQYSAYYRRRHGRPPENLRPEQIVTCLQNHDQTGNRPRGERIAELTSLRAQRLGAVCVLLGPQIPLIFMGEEYAAPSPFPYFVDHGDPALVESVRQGREAEFARFGWETEPLDPAAAATFDAARLDWSVRTEGAHGRMLALYTELLALRTDSPHTVSCDGDVILLERPDQLVVANFGDEATVNLPEIAWEFALDSGDARFADPAHPSELTDSTLKLQELSAVVLRPRRF